MLPRSHRRLKVLSVLCCVIVLFRLIDPISVSLFVHFENPGPGNIITGIERFASTRPHHDCVGSAILRTQSILGRKDTVATGYRLEQHGWSQAFPGRISKSSVSNALVDDARLNC